MSKLKRFIDGYIMILKLLFSWFWKIHFTNWMVISIYDKWIEIILLWNIYLFVSNRNIIYNFDKIVIINIIMYLVLNKSLKL